MLTLREFAGDEYVNARRREYDESRNFLKTCGKPKDWYDIWLIKQAKFTAELTRRYVTEDKGY